MRKVWTEDEKEVLAQHYRAGVPVGEIAVKLKRTIPSVEAAIYDLHQLTGLSRSPITQSPAREWQDNLTIEGDALVLPDMEAPYHHADFINRSIDLAMRWGVAQVILAGDFVHFANYSAWGAEFQAAGLPANQDAAIMEIIGMLPDDKRQLAIEALERAAIISPEQGISAEMASVRKTVKEMQTAFTRLFYIMGNHEARKLKAQEMGEDPNELLRFFDADTSKWTVSPYYWARLKTENQYTYRIEHPRGAGRTAAQDLAVQFQEHILMGHSHRWALNRDPSGRLYAIQMGHCVDEKRLAYVSQRSAKRDAHALGAVIVRGGYPYLLEEFSPFFYGRN